MIKLIADMSIEEFRSIYGEKSMLLFGFTESNTVIIGTDIVELHKNDSWIIIV